MSESENSSPAPESQSPPEAAPATTATETNQPANNEPAPANNKVTPENESGGGAPPASTNKNGPKITAGVSALKGSRPTMEDAHAVVDNVTIEGFPPEKTIGFFGVYDGHGGQHCAEFTKVNLIINSLFLMKYYMTFMLFYRNIFTNVFLGTSFSPKTQMGVTTLTKRYSTA